MKMVMIQEARLDELVKAMLDKILASTSPTSSHPDTPTGSGTPDGRVSFRNVNYHVCELVDKIKNS